MNNIYNTLLDFLPYYERNSETFKAILKAIAMQIKERSDNIEDFINQLFIDTTTWGLATWEKNLGLDINTSLSYEERRRIIKAKFRVNHHISDLMIESVVEVFTDLGIKVYFNKDGIIEISIDGKIINLSTNMIKAINEMKPAFFDYEFYAKDNITHLTEISQLNIEGKIPLAGITRMPSRETPVFDSKHQSQVSQVGLEGLIPLAGISLMGGIDLI